MEEDSIISVIESKTYDWNGFKLVSDPGIKEGEMVVFASKKGGKSMFHHYYMGFA